MCAMSFAHILRCSKKVARTRSTTSAAAVHGRCSKLSRSFNRSPASRFVFRPMRPRFDPAKCLKFAAASRSFMPQPAGNQRSVCLQRFAIYSVIGALSWQALIGRPQGSLQCPPLPLQDIWYRSSFDRISAGFVSMKIAFDLRRIGNPGIGRYMKCLVEAVLQEHLDNEYVLLLPPDKCSLAIPDFCKLSCVIPRARYYSIHEQIELPRILREHRVDLLHSPHFLLPLALPCPAVVTIHDVIY